VLDEDERVIEPLPRWAWATIAGIALAGLAWWAVASLTSEDTPWCQDEDSACPEEVLVDGHDRAAGVACLEGSLDPSMRDEELPLRRRNGERTSGWSIRSVPIEVMIELAEGEELWGGPCDGTVVAIGWAGSLAKADDILAALSS
jgi:hypothetical protein